MTDVLDSARRILSTTAGGGQSLVETAPDELLQWSARTWALADCRHLSRRLEGDLVAGGEAVLRVPARPMEEALEGSRQPGKSDPIDALGSGSCSATGAGVACGKAGWTLATATLAGRSSR